MGGRCPSSVSTRCATGADEKSVALAFARSYMPAVNDVACSLPVADPLPQPTAQRLLSLARERIFGRLERATTFPILIAAAPAGFGKSTVVREFLTTRALPHRRLTLCTGEADLFGFMREFATCLGDLAPALLTSFMGVYDRMHRLDDAPRAIAAWAVGHLESLELALIIDGLESVTDERLFTLLIELVDQTWHAPLRWIFIGDTADRFPVARWLANDRMDLPFDDVDFTITFEDLRFAVGRTGTAIDDRTLHRLCAGALNWPAAIALALSDVAALADAAGDAGQPRSYTPFALRAFLARSAAEREFLLATCLYKHFDRALLAVAGRERSDALLERLCDAGAFIFADVDGSYRYHEVFRVFLEEQLRTAGNDLFTRVALASAAVCERVGRWLDALELYTGLHAAEPLAALLSARGFELMDRGEADAVNRGLRALGEREFAAYPVALAVRAGLESLNGSFDVAEAWFRHAIKNVGDSHQRGPIVFRFATDLVRQDRRDAIDLLQPIVAEGGHDLGLSVSLAGLLATAYATHQLNEESTQTIALALEQLVAVDDQAVRAKVYYQAGYVAFFARDPERAKAYARCALDTALASHLYDIAARALSILYNVAMDYEDDVDAARLHLEALASCSIKAGSRHLQTYATLGLFEIEVLCGNLVECARLDEALRSLDVDYSVFASETLLPAQALRATWSGDFHRAYRLVAPTAEKQITPARQAQRYAEIALYAAAAGLHTEASAALDRAQSTRHDVAPADASAAFTQAYIALALTLLGRREAVLRILDDLRHSGALSRRNAQLVDAVQTIGARWADGRYSTELGDVLERLDGCGFGGIRRLIEALPLPETFRGHFGELTATEREVLIHMSAGLEAGEIAVLSGHDIGTVDGVITSLCRKLGCSSQRHAVALAKSAAQC